MKSLEKRMHSFRHIPGKAYLVNSFLGNPEHESWDDWAREMPNSLKHAIPRQPTPNFSTFWPKFNSYRNIYSRLLEKTGICSGSWHGLFFFSGRDIGKKSLRPSLWRQKVIDDEWAAQSTNFPRLEKRDGDKTLERMTRDWSFFKCPAKLRLFSIMLRQYNVNSRSRAVFLETIFRAVLLSMADPNLLLTFEWLHHFLPPRVFFGKKPPQPSI